MKRKEKPEMTIGYTYVEPKNAVEKETQEQNVRAGYAILFEATLKARQERANKNNSV